MLKKITQIRGSLFFKQLKTMLAGTFTGQLIMIGVIPVMSRLFTPVDIAFYAIVLALVGMSAVGGAFRYELTIILPFEDEKADKLLVFSMQSVIVTTIFLLVGLILIAPFYKNLPYSDRIPDLGLLVVFWPLFHMLMAGSSTGGYILARQSNFAQLARAQILRSSTTAFMLIITGFLKFGYTGLLISSLTGQAVFSVFVWWKNRRYFLRLFAVPDLKLLTEFRNFPLFSLPMSVLNVFSTDMLLYALNFLTSPSFTGLYAKAFRVVTTPLTVISLAFGNVFFKKLNSAQNKSQIYNIAFVINLITAFLILSPLIFWGEELFALILSETWRDAGKIATLLLPLTIVRFAAASVSQVYDILHKNKIELLIHLSYLSGSVIILWYSLKVMQMDYYHSIKFFVLWGAFSYFVLYLIGFYLLRKYSDLNNLEKSNKKSL